MFSRFERSNEGGSSNIEEPKFTIQLAEDKKTVKNMSFDFENPLTTKNLTTTVIG